MFTYILHAKEHDTKRYYDHIWYTTSPYFYIPIQRFEVKVTRSLYFKKVSKEL